MEILVALVIGFVLLTVFYAICLWLAVTLTRIDGTFLHMLAISAICSLLSIIPVAGPLLSLVAMFVLLSYWTDANFWPDAVLVVVVTQFIAFCGGFALSEALSDQAGEPPAAAVSTTDTR